MIYSELPEEKYIYYECSTSDTGFKYAQNNNHIEETYFTTSKIIRISKYIPTCFHEYILRYYYQYT